MTKEPLSSCDLAGLKDVDGFGELPDLPRAAAEVAQDVNRRGVSGDFLWKDDLHAEAEIRRLRAEVKELRRAPAGFRRFDVLDVRVHRRPACVAEGYVVDAGGVSAELDEVPARLAGRDAGLGGRHGSSLWWVARGRRAGCGMRGRGATSSTGRGLRRGRAAAASG